MDIETLVDSIRRTHRCVIVAEDTRTGSLASEIATRITEEAFDPNLNPIRAKVSLSLRVLSVDDLGFDTRGGSIYMAFQRQKEQLARGNRSGGLSALGIEALP